MKKDFYYRVTMPDGRLCFGRFNSLFSCIDKCVDDLVAVAHNEDEEGEKLLYSVNLTHVIINSPDVRIVSKIICLPNGERDVRQVLSVYLTWRNQEWK